MARLGRLYCLDPRRYDAGPDSAEQWLRRAVAARPDDALSAILLASLLIRWANGMIEAQASCHEPELSDWYRWPGRVDDAYWADPDYWLDWQDSDRERRTVAAQDEAERLLTRVLEIRPDDAAAATTLAGLWYGRWTSLDEAAAGRHDQSELAGQTSTVDIQDADSWYLVQRTFVCSNNGDLDLQMLLTADPAELRWACDRWASQWRPMDPARGKSLTLLVGDGGVTTIDLTPHLSGERPPRVDWAALPLPTLRGNTVVPYRWLATATPCHRVHRCPWRCGPARCTTA
jgi:hypothetical protein